MKSSTTPLRVRVLLLVVLGGSGFVAVDRTVSADEALSRKTAAGREVLIRGFAEFDADCKLRHVQTVKVVAAPANGRVEQRPGVVTVVENRVGNEACAGTKLDGLQVFYVPNVDFAGNDRFAIDVEDARHRTVRAKVDVDVSHDATAANL